MDSLTQMVLGAAVGELVLGRKIGNKAMFWGAVGGTIPDLDVLANPFLSEAESVKFHRGPSHSLFFSAVASALFGYLLQKYFGSDLFRNKSWRWFWKILFTAVPIGLLSVILILGWSNLSVGNLLLIFLILALLAWGVWKRCEIEPKPVELPSFKQWYWFFFLIFTTHILLDIFTTYGTQALWPFSDHPFAWDTISVVDPLYTVPFLIPVFLASFYPRQSTIRYRLNLTGIILSSSYLLFTVFNKVHVNRVFENTLRVESVEILQFKTTPTLFNNLLWYGVAETEDAFIKGYYSLLDEDKRFHNLQRIPKNHELLTAGQLTRDIEILKWFSTGFHSLTAETDKLHWHDLRFGNLDFTETGGQNQGSPFIFKLKTDNKGEWKVFRDRPQVDRDVGEIFSSFRQRILGIRNIDVHD